MSTQRAAEIDRIAPSRRPLGMASGHHRWTDLSFVHWRIDASEVARLLPGGLELDTWEGDAWVGLVPFHMSGVRPWWLCAVPGVSEFHETNVRTYVHCQGKPGVWFLSLEAANRLAVWIGRWRWHLNYFHAEMQVARIGNQMHYRSRRLGNAQPTAECDLTVTVHEPWQSSGDGSIEPAGGGEGNPALPGTLEHFLIERYYLYCATASGGLLRGQVHHQPYPLWRAGVEHIDESLLAAAGIPSPGPPCHAVYCPGVTVEVFPLVPVA